MEITTIALIVTRFLLLVATSVNILMLVGTLMKGPTVAQGVKIVTIIINITVLLLVMCRV